MANKRSERMSGYLRSAMMDLLQKKPFEQITVRELVDHAGVSKNSFYVRYYNLYALVQDCLLHESVFFGPAHKRRADFSNRLEALLETLDQSAKQLVIFKENYNLARVLLLNVGISPYFNEIEHAYESLTYDYLLFEYGLPNPNHLISYGEWAHLVFSGTFAIYRQWLLDGMASDIETVVKKAALFSFHTAAGCVGKTIEPDYHSAILAWTFDEPSS